MASSTSAATPAAATPAAASTPAAVNTLLAAKHLDYVVKLGTVRSSRQHDLLEPRSSEQTNGTAKLTKRACQLVTVLY
ncbi:hypothetical protein GQ42DRAFT_163566 [Ramicandelaber brevisporus]|nr:hypothetical protein GQ42DRAFT_163566 [Ramicandelaber brevisporus]